AAHALIAALWAERRAEGRAAGSRGARRPVLGLVHAQGTALEVLPVHEGDGLLRGVVVLELDEGKTPGAPRLAVGGELRIDDPAGRTERGDELLAGHVEAQVAHENLL